MPSVLSRPTEACCIKSDRECCCDPFPGDRKARGSDLSHQIDCGSTPLNIASYHAAHAPPRTSIQKRAPREMEY